MKPKLLPVIIASLLLGIVFDILFYGQAPGISVFIFTAVAELGYLLLSRLYRRRVRFAVRLLLPLPLFFSLMVCFYASGFLGFINTMVALYILLLIVQLSVWPRPGPGDYKLYHYIVKPGLVLIQTLTNLLHRLGESFGWLSRQKGLARHHQTLAIIRGVLLSIPILLVFLALFSAADPIFQRYVSRVFEIHVSWNLIGHVVVIGLVSIISLLVYSLIFQRSSKDTTLDMDDPTDLSIGSVETTVVLGLVAALFFGFIVIQIRYLFGGDSNVLTAGGYTYAEYARRGFFELIFVAVLALVLLLGFVRLTKLAHPTQRRTFMVLSLLLIAEVLVIMLSAHRRLNLYEQAYGFTELRLYSQLFMYWLVLVFGLLALRLIKRQSAQRFALELAVSAALVMVILNLLNPQHLVAQNNIDRFQKTGKIDTRYLGSLSADALPTVLTVLDSKNPAVRQQLAAALYPRLGHGQSYDAWQSYNVSRHKAQVLLAKRAAQIQHERKGAANNANN